MKVWVTKCSKKDTLLTGCYWKTRGRQFSRSFFMRQSGRRLHLAKIAKEENRWKEVLTHFVEAYWFSENPEHILHKAQACEHYYKDKPTAIRQY